MVGEMVITQSMIQQDISRQVNVEKSLIRDIAQFSRNYFQFAANLNDSQNDSNPTDFSKNVKAYQRFSKKCREECEYRNRGRRDRN